MRSQVICLHNLTQGDYWISHDSHLSYWDYPKYLSESEKISLILGQYGTDFFGLLAVSNRSRFLDFGLGPKQIRFSRALPLVFGYLNSLLVLKSERPFYNMLDSLKQSLMSGIVDHDQMSHSVASDLCQQFSQACLSNTWGYYRS